MNIQKYKKTIALLGAFALGLGAKSGIDYYRTGEILPNRAIVRILDKDDEKRVYLENVRFDNSYSGIKDQYDGNGMICAEPGEMLYVCIDNEKNQSIDSKASSKIDMMIFGWPGYSETYVREQMYDHSMFSDYAQKKFHMLDPVYNSVRKLAYEQKHKPSISWDDLVKQK